MSGPQSVLFDRDHYTEAKARSWLDRHGFKSDGKVDVKDRFLRFRQRAPQPWEKYITKTPRMYKHVRLIVPVISGSNFPSWAYEPALPMTIPRLERGRGYYGV